MYLQYQDKTLRRMPTGAATIQKLHLGQKYAKNVISHNLLRGDVTTNILFMDDNKKVIITYTKTECLKTQGSRSIRNTRLATNCKKCTL